MSGVGNTATQDDNQDNTHRAVAETMASCTGVPHPKLLINIVNFHPKFSFRFVLNK